MLTLYLLYFSFHILLLKSFAYCDTNAVKSLQMIYTTESKSVSGKWCINDCVNGRCAVDIGDVEDCQHSNDPAPTFYTTGQHQPDHRKCTSRCSKMSDDNHARCFVDNDWSKLDNCNPDMTDSFEYRDYTFADGPCADDCTGDPANGKCKDISGLQKSCYFDKMLFETVKTVNGFKCHGQCLRHEGKPYSWCYYDVGKWEYCARPALYNSQCFNCTSALRKQLKETVSNYAERMERDHSMTTVAVSDPENPIFSYTYKEAMTAGGVVKLPLVVRARVFRSHIRPRNSRGLDVIPFETRENCRLMGTTGDDEVGRLIPYKFSGPSAFYNLIPMAQVISLGSVKDGTVYKPSEWVSTERQVAEFVEGENGQVNIVVVLRYNFNDRVYPYRPYRIGWGQWGLTSTGEVVLKSKNFWNTYT